MKKKSVIKKSVKLETAPFDACADEPFVSLLREPESPTLLYTQKVKYQIDMLVNRCKEEVSWMGLVDQIDDLTYLVTEIFVPEQEVTSTTTEIEGDALADLFMELINQGKDPEKLIYHGHSHVNMAVSPSQQDEDQIHQFLQSCNSFSEASITSLAIQKWTVLMWRRI